VQDINNLINKVVVSKKRNEIAIFIKGTVSDDFKKQITKKFNKGKGFKLKLCFISDIADFNAFMDKYWDYFRELWIEYFPSCTSWFKNCRYTIDGRLLNIHFPSEIAVYTLKSKNFHTLVQKLLEGVYKSKVNIKLLWDTNTGRADEFSKLRQQESMEIQKIIKRNESKNDMGNKRLILMGKDFKGKSKSINTITQEAGNVIIEGDIFEIEVKDIKSNKLSKIISLYVTDYNDSILVRVFVDKNNKQQPEKRFKIGERIRVRGEVQYNKYIKENIIVARDIVGVVKKVRTDNATDKRIELHAHTRFSSMDGITPVEDLIKKAAEWGHKAIAITDHGVVQAFPHAHQVSKGENIKVIYGLEGYMVNDDSAQVFWADKSCSIDEDIVVVDLETTGLNPFIDKITEIGAVRIRKGNVVDRFEHLINPGIHIPQKIVKLTGITDQMVQNSPPLGEVLPKFLKFAEGSVLAAHNASFDIGFLRNKSKQLNMKFSNPVLDTLNLSRVLYPQLKSHKLNIVAKYLGVKLEKHHRAGDDAMATAQILLKSVPVLENMDITHFNEINNMCKDNISVTKLKPYHVVILAKNQKGLENLYKIVSKSHLDYFYKTPRIPKSLINSMREGLIIGSACESGEIFRGVVEGKKQKELINIGRFYDYLEIQPVGNNEFMIRNGTVKNENQLQQINMKIYQLGRSLRIPVVATGDVHFLEPQDEVYRRIIMAGKGFEDADRQAPLYLHTTEEILQEFEYLGEQAAREVVIENPGKINELIEELIPIPEETYPPKIQGSDIELKTMTMKKAVEMYGDPLPEIVKMRLEKELNAIIDNGYAVMYIIAQKLVKKSIKDGYLVGSRGSVGSSLIATMSDITEVNPLPPHYLCSECKYSEFIADGSVGTGADLPDKNCPECNKPLKKFGFDIPFEVFMGFEGDKEPDIDLNFSGEYQNKAHRFTEELFGKDQVYRAGTIATLADKTAYGFVKNYIEDRGLTVHSAEIKRLVEGCTGIKRTTGQHPGGVMIVPVDMDIHQFTPVQRPADDAKSDVTTTHFDYHAISGRLLKLDLLGHDDPTVLKMLQDLTGLDPRNIPLDDKKTMSLFSSTSSLGINPEEIECPVGSLGIPEFGTRFVRQMLIDTKPVTFEELVRISGLSHGTNVWLNNAQDLILKGIATLKQVISTRDDIMTYLIQKDMQPKLAFRIMEKVRKGKWLNDEEIKAMKHVGVPQWYIDSCQKIKYMFPKAHAVAYVTMAFRIAYYKVYYPLAFYAAYFTVRADEFDAHLIVSGKEKVIHSIRELEKKNKNNSMTQKEKSLLTILEIAREMYCRGFEFLPVNIYKSHQNEFKIVGNKLLPPLNSLQGLGGSAAQNVVKARKQRYFISVEDLRERGKLSRNVIEILREHGCLCELPESNQISLF